MGLAYDFPDANLFKARIEVPQVCNNPNECLDDMVRFCTTSTFCIELNKDQRKILALRSRHFKVMGDTLYRLGADGIFHHCVQHCEQRKSYWRPIKPYQEVFFLEKSQPEKYGRLVYGGPQLARVQPNLQKNVTYVPK